MRRVTIYFVFGLMLCAAATHDAQAQSGSRGSGTRMAPRSSFGIPSRVGGARSKTIRGGGQPTGMMNSASAARMSGGARSSGSGSRPTTGYTPSRRSFGNISRSSSRSVPSRPSVGLTRPSRRDSSDSADTTSRALDQAKHTTIPAGYRVWTDITGRYSIHGKLVALRAETVWIRRLDGKLARLTVAQLSQPDQDFVNRSSS